MSNTAIYDRKLRELFTAARTVCQYHNRAIISVFDILYAVELQNRTSFHRSVLWMGHDDDDSDFVLTTQSESADEYMDTEDSIEEREAEAEAEAASDEDKEEEEEQDVPPVSRKQPRHLLDLSNDATSLGAVSTTPSELDGHVSHTFIQSVLEISGPEMNITADAMKCLQDFMEDNRDELDVRPVQFHSSNLQTPAGVRFSARYAGATPFFNMDQDISNRSGEMSIGTGTGGSSNSGGASGGGGNSGDSGGGSGSSGESGSSGATNRLSTSSNSSLIGPCGPFGSPDSICSGDINSSSNSNSNSRSSSSSSSSVGHTAIKKDKDNDESNCSNSSIYVDDLIVSPESTFFLPSSLMDSSFIGPKSPPHPHPHSYPPHPSPLLFSYSPQPLMLLNNSSISSSSPFQKKDISDNANDAASERQSENENESDVTIKLLQNQQACINSSAIDLDRISKELEHWNTLASPIIQRISGVSPGYTCKTPANSPNFSLDDCSTVLRDSSVIIDSDVATAGGGSVEGSVEDGGSGCGSGSGSGCEGDNEEGDSSYNSADPIIGLNDIIASNQEADFSSPRNNNYLVDRLVRGTTQSTPIRCMHSSGNTGMRKEDSTNSSGSGSGSGIGSGSGSGSGSSGGNEVSNVTRGRRTLKRGLTECRREGEEREGEEEDKEGEGEGEEEEEEVSGEGVGWTVRKSLTRPFISSPSPTTSPSKFELSPN